MKKIFNLKLVMASLTLGLLLPLAAKADTLNNTGDISREASVEIAAKVLAKIDSLEITNRNDFKQGAFAQYPEYRGKKMSYILADLLLEKVEVGSSEESDSSTLVTHYTLYNQCYEQTSDRNSTLYKCYLSRHSIILKIHQETGETTPAWSEDEGLSEMLQFYVSEEGENFEILNNQATFVFAG